VPVTPDGICLTEPARSERDSLCCESLTRAGEAGELSEPGVASSLAGGVIVHRTALAWLAPPSSSMTHPALRMTGAWRCRRVVTARALAGQPFGGRQSSAAGVTRPRSSADVPRKVSSTDRRMAATKSSPVRLSLARAPCVET
jgi:hypothetical protein